MRVPPALAVSALAILAAGPGGCGDRSGAREEIRVFHAAGMTPLLDAVRDAAAKDLGLALVNEPSGSQVACRKVTELGKSCDLLMLADPELVAALLPGKATWRIDFAADAMVLAVGARAKHADEAEKDWPSVLMRDDVSFARADPDLTPTGYRTFMVWNLADALSPRGIEATLSAKRAKVVDHVTLLTPLLQNGEADYAFVYRSIAVAQGIRHVELDPRVNLGDPDRDYSAAKVTFSARGRGGDRLVTVTGRPVCWCLTVVGDGGPSEGTTRFVRWLLKEKVGILKELGLAPMVPARLYGAQGAPGVERAITAFEGLVRRAGTLVE